MMWRYDFHLFYLAGQAVLNGASPYTITDFNPPYPLAMLFALVAWMPELLAYALYLAGCLFLLWKVMRWRGIWALLSFPVWFGLFVGQVDLPLALLASLGGGWALPLLILKPQLGLVLAPWIIRRAGWKRLLYATLAGLVFLGLSFILRPTWLTEWQGVIPSVGQYATRDANLYWLLPASVKSWAVVPGTLVALGLGFWLRERRDSWAAAHLLAPLTNIYSASALAEWIGPLEVGLSWAAILVAGGIHNGAPMFVVGISILLRAAYRVYRGRMIQSKTVF